MYTKDNFIKDIENLLPDGFTASHSFGWTGFIKESPELKMEITFSYTEYFPHCVDFVGVSVKVELKEYESILKSACEEIKVPFQSRPTFRKSIAHCTIEDDKPVIKKVESSEDFQSIELNFNRLIKEPAFNFFDDYNNVKKISEKLRGLEPKEVVKHIQGAPLFSRVVLLHKLANSSVYKEKKIEYQAVLEKQASKTKKENYLNELKLFNHLFN